VGIPYYDTPTTSAPADASDRGGSAAVRLSSRTVVRLEGRAGVRFFGRARTYAAGRWQMLTPGQLVAYPYYAISIRQFQLRRYLA